MAQRIHAFREGDLIPDQARPIGVVKKLRSSSIPGGAPEEELLFYYDMPQEYSKLPEIYGRSPHALPNKKEKRK